MKPQTQSKTSRSTKWLAALAAPMIMAPVAFAGPDDVLNPQFPDQSGGAAGRVVVREQAPAPSTANQTPSDKFDFPLVLNRVKKSTEPLRREMGHSFHKFVSSVETAEQMLREDNVKEAVNVCVSAIDEVLTVRDQVVNPMWDGQEFLTKKIAEVRTKVVKALVASGKGPQEVKFDDKTNAQLDALAQKVATTSDPIRKRSLMSHYKMVRRLAEIKQSVNQLTPAEQRVWSKVLQVLQATTLVHQRVLMASEILFAKFEVTADQLRESMELLDTVSGAEEMLKLLQGPEGAEGLLQFAEEMKRMEEALEDVNLTMMDVASAKADQLEATIDEIAGTSLLSEEFGVDTFSENPGEIQYDDEFQARLSRLGGE